MLVITAPTSTIGRLVLAKLLDSGEQLRVVARDPSKLSPATRARAQVIEGSHSDPAVVQKAFDGADAVFWLVPADVRAASADAAYVDFARPAAAALRNSGVKHLVSISALGRGWPSDAGNVTATLKMDDMLAETGVALRALACGSLMHNTLRQLARIRDQGVFSHATPGDLRGSAVAGRDVAAAATALLIDRSWRGADSVPLFGPQKLSFNEQARIISEVVGRPVRYEEISTADLKSMLLQRGATEGMAQSMLNMLIAKNEGLDDLATGPTPRSTPTTFREWCQDVLAPALRP